jgi:hypothetical protein
MLVITGVLLLLVATFVDLKPVVDQNFFFSTNDPGIQQTNKIEQRFPSQPEVILAVSSRDISSPRYLERIQKLTQRVHTIGGVSAVKSLAEGGRRVVWPNDGRAVSVGPAVCGNALHVHQRRFIDLAFAIDAWPQNRHPDCEPRHDRVRDCVVASGLHDV